MKALDVNGKLGHYLINLPTSKEEITTEWLQKVTENVSIAPNYSLIAVIFKDSLGNLLNTQKKKQPTGISVIPTFIKAGKCENDFINGIKANSSIIIAASDISIGNHVICKRNSLSPNTILSICEGDSKIYQKVGFDNSPIFLVELKLVPNSAIRGVIDDYTSDFADNILVPVVEGGGA